MPRWGGGIPKGEISIANSSTIAENQEAPKGEISMANSSTIAENQEAYRATARRLFHVGEPFDYFTIGHAIGAAKTNNTVRGIYAEMVKLNGGVVEADWRQDTLEWNQETYRATALRLFTYGQYFDYATIGEAIGAARTNNSTRGIYAEMVKLNGGVEPVYSAEAWHQAENHKANAQQAVQLLSVWNRDAMPDYADIGEFIGAAKTNNTVRAIWAVLHATRINPWDQTRSPHSLKEFVAYYGEEPGLDMWLRSDDVS